MNLEIKNVSKTLPEYRQVIDLVKNSFPKEEQYPIWLLKLWALKKNVHFLGMLKEKPIPSRNCQKSGLKKLLTI